MKLPLFQQMVELNRSFDEVAAGLLRLASVPFFQRELIRHALSDVEIARVYANREFFDNFEKIVEDDTSETPVGFVPNEDSHLFAIPGSPVRQVGFFNRHSRKDAPAKLGLVGEAHVDIQQAFFECVLNPLNDLSSHAAITLAGVELTRGRDAQIRLRHWRAPL